MIIDGKALAKKVREEVKEEVTKLEIKPKLAAIIVGDNAASKIYVRKKREGCAEAGIGSDLYELPADTTEEDLLELIDNLNTDKQVSAILVQLPLPDHINELDILSAVAPAKDVDGFNPLNAGRLASGEEFVCPATPTGVIRMLEEHDVPISGAHAVVVGRSRIVGRPMSLMLLNRNATVVTCHSKTKNLGEVTKQADILVVAVGRENVVTRDMVKEGAVVIDVGMNRGTESLVGDVDFEGVKDVASLITPVPGGVGPMTVAMVLHNTIFLHKKQHGI